MNTSMRFVSVLVILHWYQHLCSKSIGHSMSSSSRETKKHEEICRRIGSLTYVGYPRPKIVCFIRKTPLFKGQDKKM